MKPGSRFIGDFLFELCTLLLLLTRLMLPDASASCVFSVVLIDLWPFDLMMIASVVSIECGCGGDDGGWCCCCCCCASARWSSSIFPLDGCVVVSVSVRLQHGVSFAASTTADIVNCALPVELNWIYFYWISGTILQFEMETWVSPAVSAQCREHSSCIDRHPGCRRGMLV